MPPRWLSLAIVVFWLGTTGWLFWHDVWPYVRPGQPPPVTIDITQEAKHRPVSVLWTVLQNDRPVFQAKTRIERLGPDSYELVGEYKKQRGQSTATVSFGQLKLAQVQNMRSAYRVGADGSLRSLAVHLEGELLEKSSLAFTLNITGEVKDRQLAPQLVLELTEHGVRKNMKLPPVEVAARASVLLPLHPVDRIRDLRPGQSWRVPVFDPLGDSVQAASPSGAFLGGGPRFLDARVSPSTQVLPFGTPFQRREAVCLVIDYEGENMKARTWVEEDTGRVLRQEADIDTERWVMRRE
jgi:hypothetical protein